jgi:hypothetical protein
MKLKQLTTALAAASLLTLTGPLNTSFAANHPLSKTSNTVDANGVEFVDLTVNVDWDIGQATHFNSPPVTSQTPALVLGKEYVREQINQVARSLFVMTNGKQKLRNVYVFNKKAFGENVDIQLLNKEGRSYATGFSGFGFEGFSTYNFLGMNTAESGQQPNVVTENFLGQVVAHELGHYFLGLADEYVEANKAVDAENPGSPAGTDTARETIMNNHESFARLSTAADYDANTQTAQGRVYKLNNSNQGASAWETLIRNPALDSAVAKADTGHNGRRQWFAAFKDMTAVPTIASLRTSSSSNSEDIIGYDSDLQVIFKIGTTEERWTSTSTEAVNAVGQARQRKLIVIDRTLPESAFNEAIATAKAMLTREAAVSGAAQAQYAVVALPQPGVASVPSFSSTTGEINNLITALANITRDANSTLNLETALSSIINVVMPTPAATSATTNSLELLTRQGATATAALTQVAKDKKLALNIVGFRLPAGTTAPTPAANAVPLATLAKQTGGDYNAAKNAQEATREMVKAADAQAGKVLNLIDASSHPALPANGIAFTEFYLSDAKYDGNFVVLKWYFDPADANKLTFSWRDLSGSFQTAGNNEGFTLDAANGVATLVVQNLTPNNTQLDAPYVMRVTATGGAMTDGIDMEISSDASTATNPISLSGAVVGGTSGSTNAPVITMRFGGSQPIKGGEVKATIFKAADGSVALDNQALLDDGQGADERANDGVYTLSLNGKLPPGEYTAVVSARTVPGTSSFNSNQRFVGTSGALPARAEQTISAEIERLTDLEFALDAGAQGVVGATSDGSTNSATSDGGGGCTALPGQTDSSLLALVLGAAGLTAWRRHQRQR